MADNFVGNAVSSAGDTFAADEIGGIKHPRVKLEHGADGSATDVSSASPLPVYIPSTLVPGTSAANLGKAEDAAHASSDTGVAMLAVRRDTAAVGSGTDGDYSTVNVDSAGHVWTRDKNSADILTALQLIDDGIYTSGTGTPTKGLMVQGTDGTNPRNIRTNSSGHVFINGNIAHDAAESGANPILIGAKAITTEQTDVATGDRTHLHADIAGRLLVYPYTCPELSLYGTGSKTDTSDLEVIAAQGSGLRINLTSVTICNASASTAAVIAIKEGSTVIHRISVAGGDTVHLTFPVPIRLTANTALNMASLGSVTTIYMSATGFQSR